MAFSSNSVAAKARAIYGKQLTREDFTQLASKETVADVCSYLKQTACYGKALAAINPQTVHRGQLEALLRKSVFDTFETFHRFDFTESRFFFRFIAQRLEIDQILSAVQAVMSGSSDSYFAELPMFLTKYSQADLPALGSAKSLPEIAELISGTSYAKVLYKPLLTEKTDINELERLLYTQYYMDMLKSVEKELRGSERKELKKAILRSIDLENTVTVYRHCFFNSPEGVSKNLLPFRYRLRNDVIDRLAAEKDISKIAAELNTIGYRTPMQPSESVEQLTEQISLDCMKKNLRLSRSAAVVYFSLSEMLGIELKNIKTVIEGIRYQLSGSDILNLLVL